MAPAAGGFPGVDELNRAVEELAAALPAGAAVTEIGASRLGEPIRMISVGRGDRNALVIGGPHPNEPVGFLTILRLLRRLREDPALSGTGYRWHIIPCADPDGARLNAGWFGCPWDRQRYARNFFRPDMDQQVEWTFPCRYGDYSFDRVLPETRALMNAIDSVGPNLMCSLHNGEYGGVYYYLTPSQEKLAGRLSDLTESLGLPLDRGPSETPGAGSLSPGVYRLRGGRERIEEVLRAGRDPGTILAGANSADYAARHGTTVLVSEVPYWLNREALDHGPAGRSYSEVVEASVTEQAVTLDLLDEAMADVRDDLVAESPFRRAVTAILAAARVGIDLWRSQGRAVDREATVAETHSYGYLAVKHQLRTGGMLLRMLDGEVAIGNGTPAIRRQRLLLDDRLTRWCVEADRTLTGEPVEPDRLAALQLGAILTAADG